MPTNLDTLRAQPLSLIGPATQALASGGSIRRAPGRVTEGDQGAETSDNASYPKYNPRSGV